MGPAMGTPGRWRGAPGARVKGEAQSRRRVHPQGLPRGAPCVAKRNGAQRRSACECDAPRGTDVIATIEKLRWLIKDAAMRRPHLTGRLEKAAFLVLLRPIEHLGGDVWQVECEDGLRFYTLRNGACACSDYIRHGT